MHTLQLVELGARLAFRGPACVQCLTPDTRRPVDEYWLASRCRQDRWARAIKRFSDLPAVRAGGFWQGVRPVLQEVLASELLTRIWAAVACCREREEGMSELEPIVVGVLERHAEARHRVLQLVVRGHGCSLQEGVLLNRLRRHTERWTDLLLGFLAGSHNVGQFAFHVERVRDFATDARGERARDLCEESANLAFASLCQAFTRQLPDASPNGDLNERIARSILACCAGELMATGHLVAADWMVRLDQLTDTANGWVQDLLHMDAAARRPLPLK